MLYIDSCHLMTSPLVSLGMQYFEHVFSLRKSDSTIVHETIPMYDNVPLSASSSGIRILVDEPRRLSLIHI